jgi:hypothetical protein
VFGCTSNPAAASLLPPLLDPLASPTSDPLELLLLAPLLLPELPSFVPPSGMGVNAELLFVLPHAEASAATTTGSASHKEERLPVLAMSQ